MNGFDIACDQVIQVQAMDHRMEDMAAMFQVRCVHVVALVDEGKQRVRVYTESQQEDRERETPLFKLMAL